MNDQSLTIEGVERAIYMFRDHRVMVDSDLAALYEVTTKVLNQAVKRHLDRFPADFMFQLTDEETEILRSQIVTSNKGRGGRRFNPYVFTEQGVAMLSSILNSNKAIRVNIEIMRAFVRVRRAVLAHQEILHHLKDIEARLDKHDEQFSVVFQAIRQLMLPPEKQTRKIGFATEDAKAQATV